MPGHGDVLLSISIDTDMKLTHNFEPLTHQSSSCMNQNPRLVCHGGLNNRNHMEVPHNHTSCWEYPWIWSRACSVVLSTWTIPQNLQCVIRKGQAEYWLITICFFLVLQHIDIKGFMEYMHVRLHQSKSSTNWSTLWLKDYTHLNPPKQDLDQRSCGCFACPAFTTNALDLRYICIIRTAWAYS